MPKVAAVVGAGPVGCLAAIAFAKMGWHVDLYDGRSESELMGLDTPQARRSINLAISARGIAALEAVDSDMGKRVLGDMMPMRGRLVHRSNGSESKQPYDITGQCINSVDRGIMNRSLLREAATHPSIALLFQHKLSTADFRDRTLVFQFTSPDGTPATKQVRFDFCVGADGSYSNVRRQLMRVVRMNFQQEYIAHDYIELRLPSGTDGNGNSHFLLDPNYLHIWPRHSFMLIALPNKDKSFTCTLFAPTTVLDQLKKKEVVIEWFSTHFPDMLTLMGPDVLYSDFALNPRGALICTKTRPYHYKDRVVLLGDAAHSMAPFFGQGLNCGLEDVRILITILRQHNVSPSDPLDSTYLDTNLSCALEQYTATRYDDAIAISDMAMDNYVEMRHAVVTPGYLLHKFVDNALSRYTLHAARFGDLRRSLFPASWAGGWLPLYTMVTFRADMSYSSAKRQALIQKSILKGCMYTLFLGALVVISRQLTALKGFGGVNIVYKC